MPGWRGDEDALLVLAAASAVREQRALPGRAGRRKREEAKHGSTASCQRRKSVSEGRKPAVLAANAVCGALAMKSGMATCGPMLREKVRAAAMDSGAPASNPTQRAWAMARASS